MLRALSDPAAMQVVLGADADVTLMGGKLRVLMHDGSVTFSRLLQSQTLRLATRASAAARVVCRADCGHISILDVCAETYVRRSALVAVTKGVELAFEVGEFMALRGQGSVALLCASPAMEQIVVAPEVTVVRRANLVAYRGLSFQTNADSDALNVSGCGSLYIATLSSS